MFHKKLKRCLFSTLLCTTMLISGCGNAANSPVASNQPENSATDTPVTEGPATGISTYTIDVSASMSEDNVISDTLYGLFLEDINHALDGGMYAELIKNRSFEYGTAAGNGKKHGWTVTADTAEFTVVDGIEDSSYLHEQNPSYVRITNTGSDYSGIYNKGYLEGMSLTADAAYNFSFYVKSDSYQQDVKVTLFDDKDTVYFEGTIGDIKNTWSKKELSVIPTGFDGNKTLRLSVEIANGSVDMDMISLMPTDTYQDTNIRRDIGEMLEALNPSFLRFPGGCVVEGRDLESMYSWKDSIGNGATLTVDGVTTTGDIAVRPQSRSIWSGTAGHPFYTTYGIGFYEFFELCEVLDCLAIPVLNAGMTCQIQSPKYIVFDVGSEEFKQCVQDALDLVEFCRGDESTYWGSVRIAMGHEEPFRLKYISIGNEQWQNEYFQHYRLFVDAFNKAAEDNPALYGDIELCVANSTTSGDRVGWNYVSDCADFGDEITTLVDEHYYETPSFFFTNVHRYDSYDRNSQAKVFLGEYAAKSNTLEAALSEAAYMTGLEKNGDIVQMACYAPLFGSRTQNQWTPDLIWYGNNTVFGSVNYYVQQLYANNKGQYNLPTTLEIADIDTESDLSGMAGLGSWMTSVAYDNLVITDNITGNVLYENDFEDNSWEEDFEINEGTWYVEDGRLIQKNTSDPADTNTGDALYFGDINWNNYTLTVEGQILSGAEGFLIPVCVTNTNNNIFWNIGGWGNTVSCLQIVSGGSKSGQVSGTTKNMTLSKDKTYTIKVIVDGNKIEGYLNDMKYLEYTQTSPDALYETASLDYNGDIILKLVNPTASAQKVACNLNGFDSASYEAAATVTTLSGTSLSDTNSFSEPEKMAPTEGTLSIAESFIYEAPAYSVNILRIPKK